jgi:hypothetical protein
MKKVDINTNEKRDAINSVAKRLAEAIEVSTSLKKKLEKGEILTEEEIDIYVDAVTEENKIIEELKDFMEQYGE